MVVCQYLAMETSHGMEMRKEANFALASSSQRRRSAPGCKSVNPGPTQDLPEVNGRSVAFHHAHQLSVTMSPPIGSAICWHLLAAATASIQHLEHHDQLVHLEDSSLIMQLSLRLLGDGNIVVQLPSQMLLSQYDVAAKPIPKV